MINKISYNAYSSSANLTKSTKNVSFGDLGIEGEGKCSACQLSRANDETKSLARVLIDHLHAGGLKTEKYPIIVKVLKANPKLTCEEFADALQKVIDEPFSTRYGDGGL